MPSLTLFCLPYAGASAAIYRAWSGAVPQWLRVVPLNMPARGVRMRDAPVFDWPPLIDMLEQEAAGYLGEGPYALFGHSLGALVALELGHALHARTGQPPVWLGVSACIAPARREREEKWRTCSKQDLLAEMRALKGTADELLDSEELMDLVMPMIRADFHLSASYARRQRPPLPSAMLALAGSLDEKVSGDPDNISAWAEEVAGPFESQMIAAGHFFVDSHRNQVINRLTASIARHLPSPSPTRSSAAVLLSSARSGESS